MVSKWRVSQSDGGLHMWGDVGAGEFTGGRTKKIEVYEYTAREQCAEQQRRGCGWGLFLKGEDELWSSMESSLF